MRHTQGFTLIELLVVIAIIGVLASVVLVTLNDARVRAADAAIKNNLSDARAQATLFYDAANYSFGSVCANTTSGGVKSIYSFVLAAAQAADLTGFSRDSVGSSTAAVCNDGTSGWAAQVPLKTSGKWFCVDDKGTANTYTGSRLTSTSDITC